MGTNQKIGKRGEKIAEDYLINIGFHLISRNYRTPYGEIDLVVIKEKQIVFVEVKTRRNTKFGFPEQAVTSKKKQHLVNSAQYFMDENPESDKEWRIDVISLLQEKGQPTKIEWFIDAVQ